MVNWDFIIGAVVLILLALIIWARVSKQTIAEVIMDIKELITGGAEEVQEKAEGVVMYE